MVLTFRIPCFFLLLLQQILQQHVGDGVVAPYYTFSNATGKFVPNIMPVPGGSRSMEPDFYTGHKTFEKFSWSGYAGVDVDLLMKRLNDKEGGYFVDVNCLDWKLRSQTFVMDNFNSWQGICVVYDDAYLQGLLANRRAMIFGAGNGSATLAAVLDYGHAPKMIDFLCLTNADADVVLANFSFDRYTFLYVALTQPSPETHIKLAMHGYYYLVNPSGNKEGILIYIHESAGDFVEHVLQERAANRLAPTWLGVAHAYVLHPHPLSHHTQHISATQCKDEEVSRLTGAEYEEMRLWASFLDRDALTGDVVTHPTDTIFGFDNLIRQVHAHQYPSRCDDKLFLISPGWGFGFGSDIHRIAFHLAIAINLGRIMLRDPFGQNLPEYIYQVPYCQNQSGSARCTYDCYYEPPSSCSIEDVCPGFYNQTFAEQRKCTDSMVTYNAWNEVPPAEILRQNFTDPALKLRVLKLPNFPNNPRFPYPLRFKDNIDCSYTIESERRGWHHNMPRKLTSPAPLWISVSTAFSIRPNRVTLAELERLRRLPGAITRLPFHSNASSNTSSGGVVAECAVGMYVRHGDKYLEMQLVPLESYTSAASVLLDTPFQKSPLPRSMFIGTETPSILEGVINWARDNGWDLMYTSLFDRARVPSAMTANVPKNDPLEYISMILNLDMHLRCRSWVSTMQSNWCRIQDELRVTVARKADLINIALN